MIKYIVLCLLLFTQATFATTQNSDEIIISNDVISYSRGIITRIEYEKDKFLLLIQMGKELIGTVANKSMLSNKLCNIAANIDYIEAESGEQINCRK